MEKELTVIEKEFEEIKRFDNGCNYEEALTFSEYCSAFLTIICC